MAVGNVDIQGDITAYDFRAPIQVPTLSTDKQQVLIPYLGIASPILTANLTSYQYSMDNGVTWSTMTPSGDSVLTSLSFTVSGTSLLIKWEFKEDIGTTLYNNFVRIRIRATSGIILSNYGMYTLNFERTVTNVAQANENVPFPQDYAGIPGTDLLVNAPKGV